MASQLNLEVLEGALQRRRAVRYALGAVAGAVAVPVLAACGAAKPANSSTSSSATSSSASSAVKPAPLPQSTTPVWPLNVAVSQVQVAGSMYATQGSGSSLQLEMAAFGNDIWSTADNCCFYGNQASGDGTWSVQVAIQAATSGWAKAGIMLRQTMDAPSVMINLTTTPGNGVNCQYRLASGKSCPGTNGPQVDATAATPIYLKMQKAGSTLTVSDSPDGTTWNNVTALTFTAPDPAGSGTWPKGVTPATSVPILTDPYFVGIVACAHNAGLRGLAGFSNITGLTSPKYTSIFESAAPTHW